MYGGDDDLCAGLDAITYLGQCRRLRGMTEFANIGATNEVATSADEQHRLDARVGLGCIDRGEKVTANIDRQSVDGWVGDGQHLNGAETVGSHGHTPANFFGVMPLLIASAWRKRPAVYLLLIVISFVRSRCW